MIALWFALIPVLLEPPKKTVANRPKLLAGAEAGSVPRST